MSLVTFDAGEELPRLYTELATDWYQLLTAPEDYWGLLVEVAGAPPRTLLELGAGSGNMASHFKSNVQATLTDRSAQMLALSQHLNPDCEHVLGDMRTLRLNRTFDAVFVHDAVCYLTTELDLRQAMETAFRHCRRGGVAIFAPDHVREVFASATDSGGHDGQGRGLRYLEWTWDPDPSDTTYAVDYAYLLHEEGQPTRCVYDRHVHGLFSRATWLRLLEDVGFRPTVRLLEHSEVPLGSVEVFVALKPAG